MIFLQYDRNLLFCNRFTHSILEPEKNVARTLNSRDDAFPKDRAFDFYIINILEIIYLMNKFYLKNCVHLLHSLDKNELE